MLDRLTKEKANEINLGHNSKQASKLAPKEINGQLSNERPEGRSEQKKPKNRITEPKIESRAKIYSPEYKNESMVL